MDNQNQNRTSCCLEYDNCDIESEILGEGAQFAVIYVGCVEIFSSMKELDFQTRSLVAKESINRVCDAADVDVRSPRNNRIDRNIISEEPCLEHSKRNVVLKISSRCLEITSIDDNQIVAKHDMPNISFASGGDSQSTTNVTYVAKDSMGWRAAYVLECENDKKAQNVISSIGQAFELRYKTFCNSRKPENFKTDTEYYNDLPNKIPPEFSDSGSERRRERLTSNLIDLNTSIEHKCDYVNDTCSDESGCHYNNDKINNSIDSKDVFDMSCFPLSPEVQYSQLLLENWFHGSITRGHAEELLRFNGDFLVRESQGSVNQYVLTGMNAGPKHLLLIDPEGVVRTKDRVFENITHLVNYHWSNRLPIISADSALLLQTPVMRISDLRK